MKIIGSILIILSSVISSYYYEKSIKENIEKLKILIDLINYIKVNIEYFSISIEEILNEYDTKKHWKKSILKDGKFEIKYIDSTLKKEITSFFLSLGKGYKKEQISLCEYTLKNLICVYDNLKKENVKKVKIYRSLSLFFGIGLVILLI